MRVLKINTWSNYGPDTVVSDPNQLKLLTRRSQDSVTTVVALCGLPGEYVVWLIGRWYVCILHRGSSCPSMWAVDDCIMHRRTISSCQFRCYKSLLMVSVAAWCKYCATASTCGHGSLFPTHVHLCQHVYCTVERCVELESVGWSRIHDSTHATHAAARAAGAVRLRQPQLTQNRSMASHDCARHSFAVSTRINKNSSGDEIANVNFFTTSHM